MMVRRYIKDPQRMYDILLPSLTPIDQYEERHGPRIPATLLDSHHYAL